jgi:hypothetical protein
MRYGESFSTHSGFDAEARRRREEEERMVGDHDDGSWRRAVAEQRRQEEERRRELPRLTKMANCRRTCLEASWHTSEEFERKVLADWLGHQGPDRPWSLQDYMVPAWATLHDEYASPQERQGAGVIAAAYLRSVKALAEAAGVEIKDKGGALSRLLGR